MRREHSSKHLFGLPSRHRNANGGNLSFTRLYKQAAFKGAAEGCGRRGVRWFVLVLLLTVAPGLVAGAANDDRLIRFDIPQQRADLALTRFAEQADITLVFPYEELRSRTANPLAGDYTVREGASILLAGTGFEPRFTSRLDVSIAAIDESRTEGEQMERSKGFLAGMMAALWLFGAPAATGEERVRPAVLEEIVVTAQKREQGYLDVPVSVSTFSGETLDLAKVTEFQELVQVSPSVTFNQTGDMRGVGVLIRGIGTTAFQTAVEPTVSVVVDGVTLGRTVQFLSDLNDIDRVEVLRGPQGTLFGKNASAGLINVITKRPSQTFESTFRSSVTNDDSHSFSGSLAGPLSDSVRGRVAAYSKKYDGWGKNLFTGKSINGGDSWGVRGKLDIDFSDRVNLYLIADVSEQDRNCCAFIHETSNNRFEQWDYAQYGISLDNNEKNKYTLDAQDGFSNTETYGLSGELTVDFQSFVLTSITAYRDFTLETNQGIDGMPYDTPTYGRLLFNANGAFGDGDQSQKQFSQELRVTTTAWEDLTLTGGLFYFDQTVDRYFYREALLCTSPSAADLSLSPDPALTPCEAFVAPSGFFDSTVETENWAVFGQADWRFADRWTASLGLRYTNDDISVGFVRETTPGPAVPPSSAGSSKTDDSALTGKVSLQHDLTDEMMVYGSYSRGYKAPAFDLIFSSTPERIADAVPSEESDAWEIGMKGEFFDRRLRLGVTLFHTEFDNLQGQATNPQAETVEFVLTSAGAAVTKGVEVDFTAMPIPNLLINGGVSYTDATFKNYPDGLCYVGQPVGPQDCIDLTGNGIGDVQNLNGKQINNAPKWKFALQGRYDIQLPTTFDLFVSSTYRWQDKSPGEVTQNPATYIDSYGVLDLVLGLEADNGRWSAHLFAKNVLDKHYVDLKVQRAGSTNIAHYLTRDAERYIGAQIEFRFGGL